MAPSRAVPLSVSLEICMLRGLIGGFAGLRNLYNATPASIKTAMASSTAGNRLREPTLARHPPLRGWLSAVSAEAEETAGGADGAESVAAGLSGPDANRSDP